MTKLKDKEKILKAAREKQLVNNKGALIRLSSDVSTETFQATRDCPEIFKMTKSEDLQPRLLHPARLAFKIEGKIKSFPDKEKLKDFVTTKPVLQEMLKEERVRRRRRRIVRKEIDKDWE